MPCGGDLEIKKLSMDDPVIKAFKSISSLIPIEDCNNLNGELEKNLSKKEIRDKYFNNTSKMSRETLIDRVKMIIMFYQDCLDKTSESILLFFGRKRAVHTPHPGAELSSM